MILDMGSGWHVTTPPESRCDGLGAFVAGLRVGNESMSYRTAREPDAWPIRLIRPEPFFQYAARGRS